MKFLRGTKRKPRPHIFWLLGWTMHQNAEAQVKCYLIILDYQTMLQVRCSRSLAVDVSCPKIDLAFWKIYRAESPWSSQWRDVEAADLASANNVQPNLSRFSEQGPGLNYSVFLTYTESLVHFIYLGLKVPHFLSARNATTKQNWSYCLLFLTNS